VNLFVGRMKELADAIGVLRDIDEGVVWDVVGVHGIGKSMFLEHVHAEAAELAERPATLAVDMTQRGLDDGFRGDYGPNASAAVLWQTFVRSRVLMLECADYFTEQLRCADFDEFRQACELHGKRVDELLAAHSLRGESGRGDPASVADQAVRTRLRELQQSLDEAFLDAWEEFTARRRVLITIDPFEDAAATELGHWLVRLSLRLPKTLTLLARVPSDITLAPSHPRMQRLDLPYLTVEEVDAYLGERFRGEQLRPGVAQAVFDYTDGHPGGTLLAAKLIRERGSDIDARALRRILDRLPDDPEQRWGKLVRFIVEEVRDPVLRHAVDAACVARSFDEPLLAALLGVETEELGAGDALKALNEHRLTQRVGDGVRPDRHRLAEFIRLSLADDVRVNHPARWERLHARAAQHFFDLLQQEEAEIGGGTYGQWFRYERPEWQANKQDWLYHSGQLRGRRELTRARFVLVFLEAFWWWDCYEEFEFNRWLIEDWERASALWEGGAKSETRVQDQQLADALRFLRAEYPRGHVKPADRAWDEMRSRLLLVRDLCGLAPGARVRATPEESRQLARARAMIAVFLAHTRRFRDAADPAADRYYGEALRMFEKLTADLALERGQVDNAVSLVGKSSALLLKSTLADEDEDAGGGGADEEAAADAFDFADDISGGWDYELLANLHRARADAHWMAGELDAAAVECGRAAAHAYWFQGQEHPPDEYTHRFYEEITGRAAERVLTVAEEDSDRALRLATSMRAQLPSAPPAADIAAAIRTGQAADVRAALFPRGPDRATELRDGNTPFMDDWRLRWEDRSDPATELPDLISPSTSPS
jgi:hypothetical protein